MIKLRFVGGTSFVSKAIQAFEYGFWASHVEAVTPNGTYLGAHIDHGVLDRPTDYDKGQFSKELIVGLPCTSDMTGAFYGFLNEQLGKPYDKTAIGAFLFNRDWQEPDSWFCSELQAAALVHCGWFSSSLAVEFNQLTPRDLLLIVSGRVDIWTIKKEEKASES